jgi:hypothetical protein
VPSLCRQVTGPWDVFVEYAGRFPERGGSQHWLHFGTALKLAKRQQMDFHVGVDLSPAAVDHFIGIGYSFSFRHCGAGGELPDKLFQASRLDRWPSAVSALRTSECLETPARRVDSRLLAEQLPTRAYKYYTVKYIVL